MRQRRDSLRLRGFDYSQNADYFITICTKNRACILGEVVDGLMRLSNVGRIAEDCWRQIPLHISHVRVDVFQIMPNHVHGIVEIRELPAPTKIRGRTIRQTTTRYLVNHRPIIQSSSHSGNPS